jgi:homoserine kinase type II
MSVYTPVSQQQLNVFLSHYACGELKNYVGISAGIENTNYFVTTTTGSYVLTLFEALTASELPYFLDLMAYLAEHGLPSAHPLADKNGAYLRELEGKPAALVQRLQGASVMQPEVAHCQAVGAMLGRMHVAGQSFPASRSNDRGPLWWDAMRAKLYTLLSADDLTLLDDELAWQHQHQCSGLPAGIIHADLFRDNVLFDGMKLTGMIDFYYACNDDLLYDLAVTINDWCSNADSNLDETRAFGLLQAYHLQRPLLVTERMAWPAYLRAGALRFWLSRLHDAHFQRDGEITHTKDPLLFRRILCARRDQQAALLALWDGVLQA